ncbi:NAC domain-containing protein 60 [Andrographis paniculata]|uniref:NAC domain-containing protein 60 n=1 Tax=Andrographis paniculata TaxID=175694 RepID=UPI0021E92CFB|nr:NAC domain-containing protein 60 [Andrographis paniculata]XP_051134119.1 NAC domain-containing protein 60 [Andrographis paniculata]XP_051134120.1 NAC domain-containing protein 60 [Andrographis paniculata]
MEDGSAKKSDSNSNSNSIKIPMEISIAEASATFPGFRFSPTDNELIQYYLKKKLQGSDEGVAVIPEIDICGYEPWDLPAQSIIQSENEWFFFSPRGRKYPNGSQSKRATESGYWKATGKERSVKSGSKLIGTKRTLVFHTGRAPKGQRTEWLMHEYCTTEKSQDAMVVCRLRKNGDFRLTDNPRSPMNERDLPAANDSTTTVALSDIEQPGVQDGVGKVAESCSKECSSSYYSHSVDSESDDKRTSTFSHTECSSVEKCNPEEEDCYADIIKDDIIKLDDSSLNSNPVVKTESKMKSPQTDEATPSSHPIQGTANRRLRLKRQSIKRNKSNRNGNGIPSTCPDLVSVKAAGNFGIRRVKFQSIFMFVVMLILLILFVLSLERFMESDEVGDASKLATSPGESSI